jgi:hypothetical protein
MEVAEAAAGVVRSVGLSGAVDTFMEADVIMEADGDGVQYGGPDGGD